MLMALAVISTLDVHNDVRSKGHSGTRLPERCFDSELYSD